MSELGPHDLPEFARAFRAFLEAVNRLAPTGTSAIRELVEAHLEVDGATLPVTTRRFDAWDHVNLQLALDAWVTGRDDRSMAISGGPIAGYGHGGFGAALASPYPAPVGPVSTVERSVAPGRSLPCLSSALLLLRDGDTALAALVGFEDHHGYGQPGVLVEVVANDRAQASAFLDELVVLADEHNAYRGQVVTIAAIGFDDSLDLRVQSRPAITAADVVLPDGVLERIDAHVVETSRWRPELVAAGQHLKRGLLLHGPPGTGKTRTVEHLLGRVPDTTVVVLTGRALHLVGAAVALARRLQPALIVLEDVDLVASHRFGDQSSTPMLFELLNEIDGLGPDADIAFVLTTNRPDLLEPALAARPGRVDLAVELPLPDDAARLALLRLYGAPAGLADGARLDAVVRETAGLTASAIRELVRRAVLAKLEGGADRDLDAADLESVLPAFLEEQSALAVALSSPAADVWTAALDDEIE